MIDVLNLMQQFPEHSALETQCERLRSLIDAAQRSHRERATVNIAPEQAVHEGEV
jgi:hypothetical protein